MICPNARVKIIRQDNIVMRDDFKNNKNYAYKKLLGKKGIELFEEMYKIKFSKFQKWYLNKLFNRKK